MGNSIPTPEELIESVQKEVDDIVEKDAGMVCIAVPVDIPNDPCRLCQKGRAFFISLPCKHRWLCEPCMKKYTDQVMHLINCPVCDKRIESIE